MEGVKMWLSSQGANFTDITTQKRILRCEKSLSSGGDYVEK
jgi:putative component of membrane protein insertase Oxa1/YidC/SpoIIIJ protein YidD